VQRVLRLSPDTTRNLIKAGFVKPARGARREYRFSFQDLIVLRAARALIDANIPARRIRRSLESLRRELPESMPLSGLSLSAVGDHVVVRDGDAQRQVDDGQYLLGLDVSMENGVLRVVEHREQAPAAPSAGATSVPTGDWFTQALSLESTDPEQGQTRQAAEVYRRALEKVGRDPLLLFNQGVLLEDLGDPAAALEAYQSALAEDPDLADCHYNLARLYESLGQAQHAIRHLGQYRRLLSGDAR